MVRNDREKLRGHVEVDEVFVWGHQSWPRWRWAKGKNIVVVAVEVNMEQQNKRWFFRGMGRVRMQVISNCGEQTLTKFIQDNIEEWSTIYTDKLASYNSLDKKGYNHILQEKSVTNDAIQGVSTAEVTPNVHIIASLMKRWLLGTHQKYCTKGGYLQDYLEEYTFRFNRRKSSDRWKLFQTLLEQVLTHEPTTRKSITKHLPRTYSRVALS
jgi:transposase-like protein